VNTEHKTGVNIPSKEVLMATTTGNGVALAAHEAIIQTASVNIQTLRVGKKQVTIGLFRQLPCDTLLDPETLQLRGVPWGHVNYWWDSDGSGGDGGHAEKLHVVWQLGDALKRAIVYATPYGKALNALQRQCRDLLDDWVLLQVVRAEKVTVVSGPACEIHLEKRIYRVNLQEPHVLAHYWGTHAPQGTGYTTESRPWAAERYAALLQARGLAGVTPQVVYAGLTAAASERDAYKTRWAKQWQVLSALPQLFIAV
jgi:hypothetical protein